MQVRWGCGALQWNATIARPQALLLCFTSARPGFTCQACMQGLLMSPVKADAS
jgi:hypothetical protein